MLLSSALDLFQTITSGLVLHVVLLAAFHDLPASHSLLGHDSIGADQLVRLLGHGHQDLLLLLLILDVQLGLEIGVDISDESRVRRYF